MEKECVKRERKTLHNLDVMRNQNNTRITPSIIPPSESSPNNMGSGISKVHLISLSRKGIDSCNYEIRKKVKKSKR